MITGSTIQKWYTDARDHTSAWRSEARELYDLVAGWQWTATEEAELKEKKRLPIVMNRVAPYVDAIMGYQVNNRQEAKFLPRENSDGMQAHVLSEAARWADDLCDAEDEITDAFFDVIVCGMGWTDTRMDYAVDPDGQLITAERVDPLEMFWDVNATKRNISDTSYVIRARKVPKDEAEKKWPKLKEIEATPFGPDEDNQPHNAKDAWKYESGSGGNYFPKEQMYLILQCQYFEDKDVYRVMDPQTGQLISLSPDKFKAIQKAMPELRYVKGTQRTYYQCFVSGEHILAEEEAPSQEGFTFKAMTGKRDRNKRQWYGVVRALKDPQKFSNKFFSDILYILATNRKGGAFVETDALADPRKAEEQWAAADALVKLNPGGLNKIRERDAGVFPTGLDRLMQYAINAVPETSGLNPELIGMADRAQPGILEAQRKQAGLTVLAPLFDALKRHTRERGRVVLDMIKRYISDGRLIRILGEDGQQLQVPLIAPDAGKYDIVVDEATTSPNIKQETFMVIRELAPLLAQAAIPMPPDIIDYMPVPATLAQKWKEAVKPKGPPPPDPKIVLETQKLQLEAQQMQIKVKLEEMKAIADREKQANEIAMEQQKQALEYQAMQVDSALKQKEMELKAAELMVKQKEIEAKNFENTTDVIKSREEAVASVAQLRMQQESDVAGLHKSHSDELRKSHSHLAKMAEEMVRSVTAPRKTRIVHDKNGNPVESYSEPVNGR